MMNAFVVLVARTILTLYPLIAFGLDVIYVINGTVPLVKDS